MNFFSTDGTETLQTRSGSDTVISFCVNTGFKLESCGELSHETQIEMRLTMTNRRSQNEDEIDPSVSRQIDENLKKLYADASGEALPQSLTALLDALRAQDKPNRQDEA